MLNMLWAFVNYFSILILDFITLDKLNRFFIFNIFFAEFIDSLINDICNEILYYLNIIYIFKNYKLFRNNI